MLTGMTWKLAILIGAVGVIMLLASVHLNRRARRAAAGRPVDAAALLDPAALRTEVLAALARDDLPAAVKIYRQRTGTGLLEATEAVRRIDSERR